MIRRFVAQYLIKATVFALIAVLLYGVVPATGFLVIVVSFVSLRVIDLVLEMLRWRSPLPTTPALANPLQPDPSSALPQFESLGAWRQSRPVWEIAAELPGVVGYSLIIPATIALYTSDFFSLRTPQGWRPAMVIALCIGLYAWPRLWLKGPAFAKLRAAWWVVPSFPALALLINTLETRHPYLNPVNPQHTRLAAERVLALKSTVVAGRHSDWVLRYARQLDETGKSAEAVPFYREALRLAPQDPYVHARLDALEGAGPRVAAPAARAISPFSPYWSDQQPINLPRRSIDSDLERIEECTVMLVAVGDVSDSLLDAVGYAIHSELGLPVYVSPKPIPLPPHTRLRGLVTGRQWEHSALVKAFNEVNPSPPRAPIKYVLITKADIYDTEANYLFSLSYPWGALVSCARFAGPETAERLRFHRTAKQSLGALIKSFGVAPSTDHNCVTSYTRSLEEFDAKGNRPNSATLATFRQAVADLNARWHAHADSKNREHQ